MSHPVPAALAKAGIVRVTDNLPEGATIDIASDFVRIFRPEIETRLLGWQHRPSGASAVNPAARPAP